MGVLDVVSLAILAILLVGVLFLILIVAAIPGVLAKKRHSPWAEAINVAGWVGVLAAYLDAGIDCSVCASSDRRRRTNCNQPDGDHRNRYCNCQYLPAPHHSSEQYWLRQLDLAPFDRLIWPHLLVNLLSAPGRSEALRRPKGDAFRA